MDYSVTDFLEDLASIDICVRDGLSDGFKKAKSEVLGHKWTYGVPLALLGGIATSIGILLVLNAVGVDLSSVTDLANHFVKGGSLCFEEHFYHIGGGITLSALALTVVAIVTIRLLQESRKSESESPSLFSDGEASSEFETQTKWRTKSEVLAPASPPEAVLNTLSSSSSSLKVKNRDNFDTNESSTFENIPLDSTSSEAL